VRFHTAKAITTNRSPILMMPSTSMIAYGHMQMHDLLDYLWRVLQELLQHYTHEAIMRPHAMPFIEIGNRSYGYHRLLASDWIIPVVVEHDHYRVVSAHKFTIPSLHALCQSSPRQTSATLIIRQSDHDAGAACPLCHQGIPGPPSKILVRSNST